MIPLGYKCNVCEVSEGPPLLNESPAAADVDGAAPAPSAAAALPFSALDAAAALAAASSRKASALFPPPPLAKASCKWNAQYEPRLFPAQNCTRFLSEQSPQTPHTLDSCVCSAPKTRFMSSDWFLNTPPPPPPPPSPPSSSSIRRSFFTWSKASMDLCWMLSGSWMWMMSLRVL